MKSNTIQIGGELISVASDGIVADAAAVKDYTNNKTQDEINRDVETELSDRYIKSETYNKNELNQMITTPETPYITVATYAELTALTEHPNGAIYRVAQYDGTQVVNNKSAEYSWDGTQYVLLAVRDYDAVLYIAQSKTDSEKAQARQNIGIQGIDDEPTPGSENLVKSGGVANYADELVFIKTDLLPTEYKSNLPTNDGGVISGAYILCRSYVYPINKWDGKVLVTTEFNGTTNTDYNQVSYISLYDGDGVQLYASEVLTNPKPRVLECDLTQYPTATVLHVTAPVPAPPTLHATVTFYEEKYLRAVRGDDFVKKTDIVDSLDSDDAQKPLSAKQGKVLNQNINDVSESVSTISEKVDDIDFSTVYNWRENGAVDDFYQGANITGRGNVIASNSKIYKLIVNIGNYSEYSQITKVKLQLFKDNLEGEVLTTKIVDFEYTGTDFHDVEFDLTDSPILYTGEIYCTIQTDSTHPKFSLISSSEYGYSAQQSYSTSTDFDTPNFVYTSGALKILHVKLAYEELYVLDVNTDNIEDGAVTEEKLSEDVQDKLNTPSSYKGIKVQLPSEIVVAAGSVLQLFYRGIVTAVNPYNYNIEVIAMNRGTSTSAGIALPRYYQLSVSDYCNIHKYTDQPLPTGSAVQISYPLVNSDGNFWVKDVETSDATETARLQAILSPMNDGSKVTLYIQDGSNYTTWDIERRKKNVNALFDFTLNVRDNNNDIIDTATSVIRTFSVPSLPITQKNILIFGASVIAKGYVANELRRRLTLTSGSFITPIEPMGLGLPNINFIGRKTGTAVNDIHQEATGGWNWGTYATPGTPRYRFYVTDGSGENVGVDETFTISGLTFTVKEKNITNGDGNFSCTYTGTQSGDVPETGSITFQGGVVNYSSRVAETTNPFWNPNKVGGAGIDFKFYTDTYCNGSTIDILVSHCGVNDIAGNTWNKDATINSIKAIARAYKEYCINNNVDGKFIISSIAVPDPTGGFGINYFAVGPMSNYYQAVKKLFELATIFETISKDDEFSSFVVYAPVMPESDGENMYPQAETNVNNRNTKKEIIGQNAYHPEELGHKIIADSIYQSICDVLQ